MQMLAHLSDDELVSQLVACTADMRRCKARVLAFLADIEERRIYLKAAASSMWDYCRRFLSMSHGSAHRFIAGARLCKQFPFLLERIERGELHISTLAHIASWLTPENVEELVAETAGKNRTVIDLLLRDRFGVEPMRGRMANALPYDAELLRMVERAGNLPPRDAHDVRAPRRSVQFRRRAHRRAVSVTCVHPEGSHPHARARRK